MDQQPAASQSVGSVIDTVVLVAAERGRLDLPTLLRNRPHDRYHISVITVSELLHGLHRANDEIVRTRRQNFIDQILRDYPVLDITLSVAQVHAPLWANLQASGQIIGPHDLWIAATCLAYDLSLVTANLREFSRVPGLQIEQWPILQSG